MRSGPAMSPLWRNPTIYESEKFKHYVRHNLPVRQVFKLCPLVSRPAARKIACLFLTDTEKRTSKTEQSSAQMTTFTAENYSSDLNKTCLQRVHRGRSWDSSISTHILVSHVNKKDRKIREDLRNRRRLPGHIS
jgi:hypothetical protein